MVFLFYPLWLFAIGKVLFTPFSRITIKGILGLLVVFGVWLIVGAYVYQSQSTKYESQKQVFEANKSLFTADKAKLEKIYASHPTSRDILIRLATIAFQTGEHEQLLRYIDQLKKTDPNNQQVQQFLQTIQ